jgi:hypothetical protein
MRKQCLPMMHSLSKDSVMVLAPKNEGGVKYTIRYICWVIGLNMGIHSGGPTDVIAGTLLSTDRRTRVSKVRLNHRVSGRESLHMHLRSVLTEVDSTIQTCYMATTHGDRMTICVYLRLY